ncbi:MAG: TolC family protein [Burkholderiaceae bacterium]|jgi:cobalt-zinc-cadmium efflux system outer membrane protein|nr:TolC family protein [Burkholderiaceae bacterium]
MAFSRTRRPSLLAAALFAAACAVANAQVASVQPAHPPSPDSGNPGNTQSGISATAATPASLPISLPVAWQKAVAANPGLQAARFGAAAAEGVVMQAKARPNPELAYSQEDTRRTTRSSTLQVNQLIELGGKREARMRLAQSEASGAQLEASHALVTLRFEVHNRFSELQMAEERLRYAEQIHELATRTLDSAEKRVAAGKVPPLEASRASVAKANAALEQSQARSAVVTARQQLASLWNGSAAEVGATVTDEDEATAPPDMETMERQLEQSPALLQAGNALDQARASSELERARRIQDPTVSLGVKRAEEVGRNQVVLGVSIPLPLFDSNAGNQLQALRKADQAEQLLQERRLQLRAQLFTARQTLVNSRQQATLLGSDVLPLAQSAYDIALRGFSLGKFNFLDVLDAQRSLFDARRQWIEQRMAARRAQAEIEQLLGTSALP